MGNSVNFCVTGTVGLLLEGEWENTSKWENTSTNTSITNSLHSGSGKTLLKSGLRDRSYENRERLDCKFPAPVSTGDTALRGEWWRGCLALSFAQVLPLNLNGGFKVGRVWEEVGVSVVWHHKVSPLLHSSLQPHPWGAAALGHFSWGALNVFWLVFCWNRIHVLNQSNFPLPRLNLAVPFKSAGILAICISRHSCEPPGFELPSSDACRLISLHQGAVCPWTDRHQLCCCL